MNSFKEIKYLIARHIPKNSLPNGNKFISISSIIYKDNTAFKSPESDTNETNDQNISPRVREFRKKLRETTDITDLGVQTVDNPAQEKEPLQAWPDGQNPHTGEIGGPRGPEPTRYGDWERKGRVTDF